MALNNPQVVRFANDRCRPLADSLARVRNEAIAVREDYFAQDIGSKINAGGAGNLVEDGSATDGRSPITGGDLYNLITLIEALVGPVDPFLTTDRAAVINKIQVNGNR